MIGKVAGEESESRNAASAGAAAARARKRIGIFGNFGLGNLGNNTTLQAFLVHLRRLDPDAELLCICTGPEGVRDAFGIEAVAISRVFGGPSSARRPVTRLLRLLFVVAPRELGRCFHALATVRQIDVLIIPGTGLLTDAHGLTSDAGPYRVFSWCLAAKLLRRSLLFVSVGAGPLYSRAGRRFVRWALALADFRSYRDLSTLQYLQRSDVIHGDDPVYPDLVFSLPALDLPAPALRSPRPVVGIGLMEDAGRYSTEDPVANRWEKYLDSLAELVAWLIAHEFEVRFIIGDTCDTAVTADLRKRLQGELRETDFAHIIDEPAITVKGLFSQLAATDIVVATRFHNILSAVLLDKPVVGIPFHHKCSSLLRQMELLEYSQDIGAVTGDALIGSFSRLWQNAAEARRRTRGRVDDCRRALEEQYCLLFRYLCPETPRRAPAPVGHPSRGDLSL